MSRAHWTDPEKKARYLERKRIRERIKRLQAQLEAVENGAELPPSGWVRSPLRERDSSRWKEAKAKRNKAWRKAVKLLIEEYPEDYALYFEMFAALEGVTPMGRRTTKQQ